MTPPPLPRRARRYLEQLSFFERLEAPSLEAEDQGAARAVARVQAGDQDGFAELYLLYFDRVYNYLRIVLHEPHAAEDATQQVFLKALEGLPRYERRRGRPFRSWLFVIVRNQAVDELRRRNRMDVKAPEEIDSQREQLYDGDHEGLPALEWLSDRELLMFVQRLPLSQRQVLVLRYLVDLTAPQIASILGRTPHEIRMLQHRAQRFLHDRLIALGRDPRHGGRIRTQVRVRQAIVLRERRFALFA